MSDNSGEKAFFDTNVLLYLFGTDRRREIARRITGAGGTISVQVLNEFVSVSRNKLKLDWPATEGRLQRIHFIFETVVSLNEETHRHALAIASRYGYDIYDANIIAAALLSQCSVLFSEDMQDGQRIGGLTIRNPFSAAASAQE